MLLLHHPVVDGMNYIKRELSIYVYSYLYKLFKKVGTEIFVNIVSNYDSVPAEYFTSKMKDGCPEFSKIRFLRL